MMRTESSTYFFRLGVIVSTGILLIFLQRGGLATLIREGMYWSLRPGLAAVQVLVESSDYINASVRFWLEGTQRLAAAEHELAQTQVRQEVVQELEKENDLLRQELGRKKSGEIVLRFSGAGKNWFIDGGCFQGVESGAPVLYQGSFLGKVGEVDRNFSVVQTLVDPSFRLPVLVGTTSAIGLFETARGVAEVTQLSAHDSFAVGDTIVTSGLEKIPSGLPVGKVLDIQRDESTGRARVLAEPFFRPSQADFVTLPLEEESQCP